MDKDLVDQVEVEINEGIKVNIFPSSPQNFLEKFLFLGVCCSGPPAVDKTCLAVSVAFVLFAITYITVIVYFLFR